MADCSEDVGYSDDYKDIDMMMMTVVKMLKQWKGMNKTKKENNKLFFSFPAGFGIRVGQTESFLFSFCFIFPAFPLKDPVS